MRAGERLAVHLTTPVSQPSTLLPAWSSSVTCADSVPDARLLESLPARSTTMPADRSPEMLETSCVPEKRPRLLRDTISCLGSGVKPGWADEAVTAPPSAQ